MTTLHIKTLLLSALSLMLASFQNPWKAEAFIGLQKQKLTHLHFYRHDNLSPSHQSAFMAAHAGAVSREGDPMPFGTIFVVDDTLTEGPDPDSKVVGNAQGSFVSSGRVRTTLVVSMDFGFTSGKFNGSSISVFTRNPITETIRELAVVGGRGKFRFAQGFVLARTLFSNRTSGDSIVEYNVTVLHYKL